MEPIVSPWIFYWIGIIGNVKTFLLVLGFLGIVGGLCGFFAGIDVELERVSKIGKSVFFISLFVTGVAVMIPDQTTLTQMIIAQNVTPQTLSKTIDTGKLLKEELKQDVIDIIQSVTEKQEK